MTVLPLSEAKARLSELADEVHRTHDRIKVTRNGRDHVVILSSEDLESMEATLELLADQPATRRLADAKRAADRGDLTPAEDLAELMQRRRSER